MSYFSQIKVSSKLYLIYVTFAPVLDIPLKIRTYTCIKLLIEKKHLDTL